MGKHYSSSHTLDEKFYLLHLVAIHGLVSGNFIPLYAWISLFLFTACMVSAIHSNILSAMLMFRAGIYYLMFATFASKCHGVIV